MFGPRHLVRRLVRRPLVSASIICGIALAVALGVAGPLASNALASLGLRATVDALPPISQNIQLTRNRQGFTPAYRERVTQDLQGIVEGSYGVSYLPFTGATADGAGAITTRLRVQDDLADHVTVEGRAPQSFTERGIVLARPRCDTEQPIEAMISAVQAPTFGFAVGDRICVGETLAVQIVGLWQPRDEQELYWFGDRRPFDGEVQNAGAGGNIKVAVLMLAPDDFEAVAQYAPPDQTSYILRILVRPGAITLDSLTTTDEALRTFRTQVASLQPRTTLLTGLDGAISTYTERFRLLQSALTTLLLATVTLAIVYIILVGALATEQQSAEIAVLRSRGASGFQLMMSQIAQALVLVVPGLVLGLALGLAGVALLSRTALFGQLRGRAAMEFRWTSSIAVLTAIILLVVVVSLVFAAWPAMRQSLVTLRQERARPPRRSGWRRVQVDGLIVLLAALGYWQLQRYGSGLVATVDGSAQFNLLSLAAPVLILAAGAVLFLRLFPFAARALSALLARGVGIVSALSAWQLARNPLLYGRLVLLLILTVGLGVYSQTVSRTIAHEQLRQSLLDAGADVRIELGGNDDVAALVQPYNPLSRAAITRLPVEVIERTDVIERQIGTATLIASDGGALATVLEQSGSTNQGLLSSLRRISAGTTLPLGLALPSGIDALRVGVRGAGTNVTLYAKIADVNGTYEVELGTPTADWQTLEAAMPPNLQEPITFQSLLAVAPPNATGSVRPGLALRQLETVVDGAATMLDDFADLERWEGVGTSGRVNITREPPDPGDDTPALRASFGSVLAGSPAVVRYRIDDAIPVYSYRPASGVSANPGQTLLLQVDDAFINVRVQERIARLPGENTPGQTLLVADQKRLQDLLTYGLASTVAPTEVRLALRPGATLPEANTGNVIYTKAAALLLRASDPLGNGVRVILLLGFAAAVVLSLVGFLTYAALTIRARQIEWSILSALGIPGRDLLLLVALEQGFVLASGLIAGLVVGVVLTATTTPFLQVVARSTVVGAATVDWVALGIIAATLLLALAGALAILLVAMQRRGLTRELRMGEA